MGPDNFAHNKQSETETIINFGSVLKGRSALERFEHLVQGRLIDAWPGVSDLEMNVALLASNRDMDGVMGYSVFDRIDNQVAENPLQAQPIPAAVSVARHLQF